MADVATPNLPSRDVQRTVDFYRRLGFTESFRDDGWLILQRGTALLEFFTFPGLDPASSSFSCCLRLDDVDELVAAVLAAGVPETTVGWPRVHPPRLEDSGLRIGYLVDPDGTLLRLIQNP